MHDHAGISRHTIVCCAAKYSQYVCDRQVHFTGTKKMPFSCIHSLIMAGKKLAMFAVETPSGWGTSHFKFELNPPDHH